MGTAQSYRGARRAQPLTRGPEASDTAALQLRVSCVCAPTVYPAVHISNGRGIVHSAALLATRRRHACGVQVQEQLCRRALHARADGLDAAGHLMLTKGAVCTGVFVTEFSGGATPHRSGVWH